MSMTADQIVDRRRLRRKLTFWRVVGFLAMLVVIAGAVVGARRARRLPAGRRAADRARSRSPASSPTTATQIETARQARQDRRRQGRDRRRSIRPAAPRPAARRSTRACASSPTKKPTVATIGTFGASAAYMAAIATDHIVARRTSITGSIGVLFEYPGGQRPARQARRQGRGHQERAAQGRSPTRSSRPPPEARAVIQGVVNDTYNWFVDIVAERRGLARADALALADGRIYTGHQALGAKLIDEIGGEEAAIAWLGTKGVDTKLPVSDWEPDERRAAACSRSPTPRRCGSPRRPGLSPELLRGGGARPNSAGKSEA